MCILFADLVGSTAFKFNRPDVQGIERDYRHNSIVHGVVEDQFGGVTVKYLGDGVMAYFEGEDCCRRAIQAGLGIVGELDKYNHGRNWEHQIVTKIGVHFGPVWMLKSFGRFDPMGSTVDIASRLCSIAPRMHLVVTEATFEKAGGTDVFPQSAGPQKRRLKDMPETQLVHAVTTGNRKAEPIRYAGSHDPYTLEAQKNLDEGRTALLDRGDLFGAYTAYKAALGADRRNFEAHFRIGQILASYDFNPGLNLAQRLGLAYEHFCAAKAERPESCMLWKMLSWVQFRRFSLLKRDGAATGNLAACAPELETLLNEAINYADHAREIAEGLMDEFGAAVTRIYLIIYLNERLRYDRGGNAQEETCSM